MALWEHRWTRYTSNISLKTMHHRDEEAVPQHQHIFSGLHCHAMREDQRNWATVRIVIVFFVEG